MYQSKNIIKSMTAVILAVLMIFSIKPVKAVSYSDVIPEMNNIYPYSVAERRGSFWGSGEFIGNSPINMYWHQYTYLNSDASVVDTTRAKYIEFDVWSDADILSELAFWLSCSTWHESGRAKFEFPRLRKGWNHVAIDLSKVIDYANFSSVVYDRSKILSFFLEGTPLTEENIELNLNFANWAFTTDEAVASKMNNVHPFSVFEKKGLVYNWIQASGETTNWQDSFSINNGDAVDATNAEYLEFDLEANIASDELYIWLSTSSGDLPARKLYNTGKINAGYNHIVIRLSQSSNMYETAEYPWSDANIKNIFFQPFTPSHDYNYNFYNFAFTADVDPNMSNSENVPEAEYYSNDIIAVREVDLKGSSNNTSDERYFNYQTYTEAFYDMMKNPIDITKAEYIEFDYYSDREDTVNMSLGSLHEPNGFEFYDNRSMQKTFNVNSGWNHIVLKTEGEYRIADSTTLKSYNPEKVTGFILHNVDSDYVRLTNVALTFSSFEDDPVLNYRDDFDIGAVMHAPNWSLSYRFDNIELQLKQLVEMGGSLLRIDAVDNFTQLDKTVKLCNAYGIKVMLIVYIPGRTFDPDVEVDLEAIRKHYRTYATRYDEKHGCGKIDYIQIDNEMDVAIMGWAGMGGSGSEISEYPEPALSKITEQVKAASEGIDDAGTDVKRIINIAWVHYGLLKYFYQAGVEWDITGHDWYQDMFGYGGDPSEFYGSGQELYDLFKKPIIICETNMWMSYYTDDDGTIDPDYKKSSWWDPLVEAIQDYYNKDFVIGCTVYEFYDEQNQNGGEGHFGMNEVNADGTFKAHKPIYYRVKHLFDGQETEQLVWHEVEPEYSVWGDYDMRNLISIKNALLEGNGAYKADYDFVIDGTVDSRDFTFMRKYLFENL